MQTNSAFNTNIQKMYGVEGTAWLQKLPAQIAELAQLWDFQFLHPLSDLSYNFVALVQQRQTATPAILKIAPPNHHLAQEVKWLNCFTSTAPSIYAFDAKQNAFLMEQLASGHALKELVRNGDDDEATRIICQTIRSLQTQRVNEPSFTHLSTLPKALVHLQNRFDENLLAQANAWFHDLTSDRSNDTVLHGDLHHDNILTSGTNWKVIDPHGYIGDPPAEVGAMIRNPFDCFPDQQPLAKIITRRLHIMRDELPFDPQRIQAWAFCMTVLSAAWNIEDHGNSTEREAAIAAAINHTKF